MPIQPNDVLGRKATTPGGVTERLALALIVLLWLLGIQPGRSLAQMPGTGSRTFPETGKTVTGIFLEYWDKNGGLAQHGYPISELMDEVSPLNGKTYIVQYFERAVFEYHPENQPPYNVLLSQLGTFRYKQKYPNGAPGQTPNNQPGSTLFSATSHRVGGMFLEYWQEKGGLAQQGYPITDEFQEKSNLDGKVYTVQYFERAVFELHPENQPPYDVLLSQLGAFRYKEIYEWKPAPTQTIPGPTATPAPCADIPASHPDVLIRPGNCVGLGETVFLRAKGYRPGQQVCLSIQMPEGSNIYPAPFCDDADEAGVVLEVSIQIENDFPVGQYTVWYHSEAQEKLGYFKVIPSSP
ncbi:MAG: hypothetical protein WCD37_05855 [Chloroflexia bacterium]